MSKLLKSTAIVSLFTMLSRILGLVRDMVLMSVFGTGGMMDAFLVAFKLPNFFRRLFAEGAFSQAFVPVLSDYQHHSTLQDIQILVSRVAGALLLIVSALTALMVVFAPWVIGAFAVGYVHEPTKFATAVTLLRITFPYLLFIAMTAFASSILQSVHRFALPAFAPVLLNVCMIVGAVWVSPYIATPIMAVGYAVAVAGLLQLLIQLPALRQERLLVMPKVDFAHVGVRRILKLMLPALFGVSVTQINMLVNTVLASTMVDGSVSWLYTAERMSELPLGLIGVAIGTVILPSLSKSNAQQDSEQFRKTLDWAVRATVLVGVPASLALLILSPVLMVALFEHGQFSHHDAMMSGLALQGLSGGILGFMLIKVFAPAFFARHDSRTPVKVGVVSVIANVVLSVVLAWAFGRWQIAPHAGLGLANTLASFVNAGLLYFYLTKQGIFSLGKHWRGFLLKIGVANMAMVAILAVGVRYFPLATTQGAKVAILLTLCVVGALMYAVSMLAMGFRFKDLKPNLD
ncbi:MULTISPECIES: murein biosynthesis integral membrane protein MurJ [unclassified Moraxella]|uniref:murein biosynthesis integral membrane protein MurJ n=1 Tax=unclassified Moraxella TaxID=2685852 RepID=UPI003AF88F58